MWNVEYQVHNARLRPRVQLRIGGSTLFGAIEHIERFGFYGGGGVDAALAAAASDKEQSAA